MARGRQQKWICQECKKEFSVQGYTPKSCCFCGSNRIGRAPSVELAEGYSKKREELARVCERLNPVSKEYFASRRSMTKSCHTGVSRKEEGTSRMTNLPRSQVCTTREEDRVCLKMNWRPIRASESEARHGSSATGTAAHVRAVRLRRATGRKQEIKAA